MVHIKVVTTERPDISENNNTLVLKKFGDLKEQGQTVADKGFKKLVESRSSKTLRTSNLLSQSSKFMKKQNSKEMLELTQKFVNSSNTLITNPHLSYKDQKRETAQIFYSKGAKLNIRMPGHASPPRSTYKNTSPLRFAP